MTTASRLKVTWNGRDVSDEVSLGKGKANPFGWSAYDLMHGQVKIADLYCGEPTNADPAYTFEVVPIPPFVP